MSQYRKWTAEEINEIVSMRQGHKSWNAIVKKVGGKKDNVIAAYRRAVGAKYSSYKKQEEAMGVERPAPVIAIIDIETLPMIIYAWSLWDDHNGIEQVIEDSCMLSWAGRYLNDPKMYSDIMTPEEAKVRDTSRIAESVWQFLSKAHAVVGHNFSGFDVKFINTEFLKHGLPPLKYVIIDTLQIAKQNFRFSSNKMKFINDQLGIRNKVDNDGFPLWRACSEGDPDSLKTMLEYNVGDIAATEDLFWKIKPYVKNVNVALYNENIEAQCPSCGSTEVHQEGYYYTPAGKWPQMRCEKCGTLARTKANELTTEKKKSLLINS